MDLLTVWALTSEVPSTLDNLYPPERRWAKAKNLLTPTAGSLFACILTLPIASPSTVRFRTTCPAKDVNTETHYALIPAQDRTADALVPWQEGCPLNKVHSSGEFSVHVYWSQSNSWDEACKSIDCWSETSCKASSMLHTLQNSQPSVNGLDHNCP